MGGLGMQDSSLAQKWKYVECRNLLLLFISAASVDIMSIENYFSNKTTKKL